jgi:hypothetical protein
MATGRDERTKQTRPLTSKQQHFARCCASGMTQSQAYREAYDIKAATKASTVHVKASELASDGRVRGRIDDLIRQKEAAMLTAGVNDRHKVLADLRILADQATPADGNRIRALELLGKTCGVFIADAQPAAPRTASAIADELEAALEAALAGSTSESHSSGADCVSPLADGAGDVVH